MQRLLDAAGLRVRLKNSYQAKTKGEMLLECKNQSLLLEHASRSVSCGRYRHFGYKHCGRCVPCLVRRAAFLKWGVNDETDYLYDDLGRDDEDHASFDDVRSVAMAVLEIQTTGVQNWMSRAVSTVTLGAVEALEAMVTRGLGELDLLLKKYGVK